MTFNVNTQYLERTGFLNNLLCYEHETNSVQL